MKNQKNNIKRIRRLIALLVLFVLLAIISFLLFQKKDYSVIYHVDDYEINEKYDKAKDYYSFVLKKDNKEYFTVIYDQHFTSKKIIYEVEDFTTEEESCILIRSGKARFTPLCRINDEQVSYHLVSDEMKSLLPIDNKSFSFDVKENYKGVNIFNYLNATYYIWNYRGFYQIRESKKEEISLFSKDIYSPSLITQVGDILFIPDYDANYFFDKVYLLYMNTGKVDTWNLSDSIYFDSSVLGVYQNELYLVDKHEKIEWKLNLNKKKMERIGSENKGGKIYSNGWKDISMNKLLYQNNFFQGVNIYDFVIQNNGLYALIDNHYIRVRNNAPDSLIRSHDGYVYYFVGNQLFTYNDNIGEVLLLDYFEWNFNSENVIFVLN